MPTASKTSRTPKRAASSKPVNAPAPPGATPVQIGNKTLYVKNLTKILYPKTGFTKGDVIDYYLKIAPTVLPYLKGRPLTLKRYPNGVTGMFFYEKRCPSHRPEWIETIEVWSEGNNEHLNYCAIDNTASLIWVANLASLELHTLLSRGDHIDRPTMMVFDLDPGAPASIIDCCRVGLLMRDLFAELGLQSFPKASGSKGLHFYVPLNTPVTFDQTKECAHAIARLFERQHPDQVISSMSKSLRAGKVFVDWSQNDSHKTTVCPYSLRARETPTVSTPITWDECKRTLKKGDPGLLHFEAADVLRRVKAKGDLFEPVLKLRQRLPTAKSL